MKKRLLKIAKDLAKVRKLLQARGRTELHADAIGRLADIEIRAIATASTI